MAARDFRAPQILNPTDLYRKLSLGLGGFLPEGDSIYKEKWEYHLQALKLSRKRTGNSHLSSSSTKCLVVQFKRVSSGA